MKMFIILIYINSYILNNNILISLLKYMNPIKMVLNILSIIPTFNQLSKLHFILILIILLFYELNLV